MFAFKLYRQKHSPFLIACFINCIVDPPIWRQTHSVRHPPSTEINPDSCKRYSFDVCLLTQQISGLQISANPT